MIYTILLGVCNIFNLSVLVLNSPGVSEVMCWVYVIRQSLISRTEQSRYFRSDVLDVGYYFSLSFPVLNCLDVSPRDVLGVCDYCSLSFPVLNSPDVSEVICWV